MHVIKIFITYSDRTNYVYNHKFPSPSELHYPDMKNIFSLLVHCPGDVATRVFGRRVLVTIFWIFSRISMNRRSWVRMIPVVTSKSSLLHDHWQRRTCRGVGSLRIINAARSVKGMVYLQCTYTQHTPTHAFTHR